jgi:uncharacterized protein (TIGR00730 family)
MDHLRRVCVYCGSQFGARADYAATAVELGVAFADRGIGLVYGGGSVGLMGTLADACVAAGGEVIGVIPGGLFSSEVPNEGLADLRVVSSMHERKALMSDLSDGFLVLPGGLGTLDEVMEALTWSQIGIQSKPVVFIDVAGYWAPLFALLDHLVAEGFVSAVNRELALRAFTVPEAFATLAGWSPPAGFESRGATR